MKKKYLCVLILNLLGLSSTSFAQLVSGGLANVGNPSAVTNPINLLFNALNATMNLNQGYWNEHGTCPKKDLFYRASPTGNNNTIQYVTNGPHCDVIGQFGSNAPGPLQGKTIRIVIAHANNPEEIDFSFQQSITNIDWGSNGVDPSFLLNQPTPYTWSHTLQNTSFGNVPSASISHVLNDDYNTINQQSSSANSSSSTSSSSGSNTANIVPA